MRPPPALQARAGTRGSGTNAIMQTEEGIVGKGPVLPCDHAAVKWNKRFFVPATVGPDD